MNHPEKPVRRTLAEIKPGNRFERLTVLRRIVVLEGNTKRRGVWICQCDCGNITKSKATHLRNEKVRSCGCLKTELSSLRFTIHGHSKRANTSKTYRIFRGMLSRCFNPKSPEYKYYGGRGITVCNEWKKFETFLKDMGEAPTGLSIERKENSGNYCKSNCVWATRKVQCKNKRNNRLITLNGETKCMAEWAEQVGLTTSNLFLRLKRGWPEEKAVFTPSYQSRKDQKQTSASSTAS